jgi:predicted transcriptional regulator
MRMNATLKQMIPYIESWPEEDQAALAEIARGIEARRAGVYLMTSDEERDVNEGLAQADRGEYASDENISALWSKFATV